MRRFSFPSAKARIPFYAGIATCAWPRMLLFINDSTWSPWLPIVMMFFQFVPLLSVPAFQTRSWKRALMAILVSPILMCVDCLVSIPFSIDNRIFSDLPSIVPGALNEMNPGGSIGNLIPDLAIFNVLVIVVLARSYRGTVWLNLDYAGRALAGLIPLMLALIVIMPITTLGWSDLNISNFQNRTTWVIASVSWLVINGLYWMFVLGPGPQSKKSALGTDPSTSSG